MSFFKSRASSRAGEAKQGALNRHDVVKSLLKLWKPLEVQRITHAKQSNIKGSGRPWSVLAGTTQQDSPTEVIATQFGPVVPHDVLHPLFSSGHDGQPHQHRPQAILLPDVIRAWWLVKPRGTEAGLIRTIKRMIYLDLTKDKILHFQKLNKSLNSATLWPHTL